MNDARCKTWICGKHATEHQPGCPLWEPPLPSAGERPVFGEHRQYVEDAETAPAWRPDTEAQRDGRFRRWVSPTSCSRQSSGMPSSSTGGSNGEALRARARRRRHGHLRDRRPRVPRQVTPAPVADGQAEPCGCAVCLALLELAASAERGLRASMEERKMRVVDRPRRRRKAA